MRKGIPIFLLSLLTLGIISTSCKKRPPGVLSEGEMVDLITDIELADAYLSTSGPGASRPDKKALTEAVLKKHGVTHAELDSTIAYYGRNLDDYYRIYEKVEKNLRSKNQGIRNEQALEGDNIWPYGHFAAFLPNQYSDGITFSMPADALTPGNTIEWSMRLTGSEGVDMILGVEYDNGTSSISKKNGGGTRNPKLTLQTDTALTPKRIFGVMNIPTSAFPLWADSIKLVKNELDTMEYSKIRQQHTLSRPVSKQEKEKQKQREEASDSLRRDISL